jgi:chemotaxis protein CheX
MSDTTTLKLGTRITQQSTPELVAALKELQNTALEVDASAVKHIGAPGFEALLAAARSWQAAAVSFAITAPSSAFIEGLGHVGLAAEEFGISEG